MHNDPARGPPAKGMHLHNNLRIHLQGPPSRGISFFTRKYSEGDLPDDLPRWTKTASGWRHLRNEDGSRSREHRNVYEWYPRDPVNAPSLAPLLEPHTDTSSESESDQDDDDDDGDSNDQDDQIPGTGPPD